MFLIYLLQVAMFKIRRNVNTLRDGPFDIQGGSGILFLKIVCFPIGLKKSNVSNEVKKKVVLHSVKFF